MYILVEKDVATEKKKKNNKITWKTYGLVSIGLLYLNECTSNFVDYPTKKKNAWKVDPHCRALDGGANT